MRVNGGGVHVDAARREVVAISSAANPASASSRFAPHLPLRRLWRTGIMEGRLGHRSLGGGGSDFPNDAKR